MKKSVLVKLIMCISTCLLFIKCESNNGKSERFLLGEGIGISNATLMVADIEEVTKFYQDTLGFNIWSEPKEGLYNGTLTSAMYFGDLSVFEFLSVSDSVATDSIVPFIKSYLDDNQGIRLFALSSSSVDSTYSTLSEMGIKTDSITNYQSRTTPPKGWSSDNPKRKRLDFNATNPPAHLPQFIEKVDYGYERVNKEWKTYYVFRRMYNTHPNGVVGIRAMRIVVEDLNKSTQAYMDMGFEIVEQTDSVTRISLYNDHELHLVTPKNKDQKKVLETDGEGVYAIRFDVENIDSTHVYLEKELPSVDLSLSSEILTIPSDLAFGVQLEFIQETEKQSILARTYSPSKELDTLAKAHTASLYNKYCALCHGENREGYAADNAPSLKSKSLLGTSMHTNFMRYTIQYGRANTAMAGYLDTQGGPLEYIEIELIIQWLNELAEVTEPTKLSRDPIDGDIKIGASIYESKCAVCHGENGEGVSAPALGNPMTLATATDHFLRYAIAEGRDGTPMIAYKDSLTSDEIDGVVAFLRSRAAGWDVPESIEVKIPTPEEYIINPNGENPSFELREGKYVSSEQVNEALKNKERMIILDARSEVAWRQMHIPGAIPVPYYEEPENFINDIPNDGTQIVVYCACPHAASGRVQSTLRRNGFKNTAIIDEGILVWAQLGFPVRNGN